MSFVKGAEFDDQSLISVIRDLILECLSFKNNFEERKDNFDSEFKTFYLGVLGIGHLVYYHSLNYYLLNY